MMDFPCPINLISIIYNDNRTTASSFRSSLSAAYQVSKAVNVYATYATGFKSVGLNLNGLPTDALNRPVLSAAAVKPEDVRNIEVGVKTEPVRGLTANLAAYDTEIKDFQTPVTNASVAVLRGYLANAEKVRVRGAELDVNARLHPDFSLYTAVAYTDGKYVSFPDAPPPLEDTGGPASKDISGTVLPGISKWAVSLGGEYAHEQTVFGQAGHFFGALDSSHRSDFSSSPSYSATSWWTATPSSTRESGSAPRTAGRCSCGHATCSTGTITSC